jgi:hypothetical protein
LWRDRGRCPKATAGRRTRRPRRPSGPCRHVSSSALEASSHLQLRNKRWSPASLLPPTSQWSGRPDGPPSLKRVSSFVESFSRYPSEEVDADNRSVGTVPDRA